MVSRALLLLCPVLGGCTYTEGAERAALPTGQHEWTPQEDLGEA